MVTDVTELGILSKEDLLNQKQKNGWYKGKRRNMNSSRK